MSSSFGVCGSRRVRLKQAPWWAGDGRGMDMWVSTHSSPQLRSTFSELGAYSVPWAGVLGGAAEAAEHVCGGTGGLLPSRLTASGVVSPLLSLVRKIQFACVATQKKPVGDPSGECDSFS